MRGLFGLVSLLVCALIVAYIWASHTAVVSKSGNVAMDQARQLSGHGEDGHSALDSIKAEAENDPSGHFKDLLITDITPGGAMEKFYGFKKGDRIVTEGQYEVTTNGDSGTATAMLLDAFEKFQPVVVMREGRPITLPEGGAGKTIQDEFNQLQHLGQK